MANLIFTVTNPQGETIGASVHNPEGAVLDAVWGDKLSSGEAARIFGVTPRSANKPTVGEECEGYRVEEMVL